MTRRASYGIALALCLAVALGAFALRTRPTHTEPSTTADGGGPRLPIAAYEARLQRLDEALQREREQRAALAMEVAELRGQMAERPVRSGAARASDGDGRSDARARVASDEDGRSEERRPQGIDVDRLVAAGFPEDRVRAFKEKIDQVELDRLYLRDVAAREGWLDTPRFREEDVDVDAVVGEARSELGEDFYDWLLYSTGRPNRVRVGDVIGGSAAATAGLRPGDVILGYGEQRVFDPEELRTATTGGTAGDATSISVLRDGRERRFVVPRGPLGVRIEASSEEPRPAG
ncbi:MAG: PDZ domain-containing protein [Thermodesulfobacteriota bacterium]